MKRRCRTGEFEKPGDSKRTVVQNAPSGEESTDQLRAMAPKRKELLTNGAACRKFSVYPGSTLELSPKLSISQSPYAEIEDAA